MFSQTAEYAVRAAIEIATRPEGENVLAAELGDVLGIPPPYLAKILQQLVRTRVLRSLRGRQGGFRLARPAPSIRLRELVEPFEDLRRYEECILGQPVCSDAGACPLHEFWGDVRARYLHELDSKTLADLARFQSDNLAAMKPSVRSKLPTTPGMTAWRSRAARKSR